MSTMTLPWQPSFDSHVFRNLHFLYKKVLFLFLLIESLHYTQFSIILSKWVFSGAWNSHEGRGHRGLSPVLPTSWIFHGSIQSQSAASPVGETWRSETSRYHGSQISWSLIHDDGDGNENDKKAIALARASRFLVHFLAVVARPRHETSQFHSPALWSRWSKYGPFGFNPRKFRQHLTK